MGRPDGLAEIVPGDLSEGVFFRIDLNIYSKEAALQAAYWMTDRCHVHFAAEPDGVLVAEIVPKSRDGSETLADLCRDFENALIDCALRIRIAAETRDLQQALLRRAFSEALPKAG
nr:His-Xaa-Ser system protein HxsD [uncultured Rhodopila sp.]